MTRFSGAFHSCHAERGKESHATLTEILTCTCTAYSRRRNCRRFAYQNDTEGNAQG